MQLSDVRTALRELAQKRQSAWMAEFDAALEQIIVEQRKKGRLHHAEAAERFAKCAEEMLSRVGSELSGSVVDELQRQGKGHLTEREVLAEFSGTMKFGRDRLASKLLRAIDGLELPNRADGADGFDRFKKTSQYEPGQSEIRDFFAGHPMARGGKPLSEWRQTERTKEQKSTPPARVWFVALSVSIGIILGASIWLFSQMG